MFTLKQRVKTVKAELVADEADANLRRRKAERDLALMPESPDEVGYRVEQLPADVDAKAIIMGHVEEIRPLTEHEVTMQADVQAQLW